MLRRRYFLTLALLLAGLGASAEWLRPVPRGVTEIVTSPDENGQLYYMYDAVSNGFYGSGNQWGTQGSCSAQGAPMFFVKGPLGTTSWDGKTYLIHSLVSAAKGWDNIFIAQNGNDYLPTNDCSNRGDDLWCAEWENGKVKFYAGGTPPTYKYCEQQVGHKVYIGNKFNGSTGYFLNVADQSIVPVEWTLVMAQDMDSYRAEVARYNAGVALGELILKTETVYPGIDLAQAKAVYGDNTSSAEQIAAASASVPVAVRGYISERATFAQPQDATSFINNPDYTLTHSSDGWQANPALNTGEGAAEVYNKSGVDVRQTLTGLPSGLYKLNVHGLFRVAKPSDKSYYDENGKLLQPEAQNCYVYASSGALSMRRLMAPYETGLSESKLHVDDYYYAGAGMYAPDRIAGFNAYNEAGFYHDNATYVSVTNDTLDIGIKCEKAASVEWCMFDDWSLTYFGAGADAYNSWRDEFMLKFRDQNDVTARKALLDAYATLEAGAAAATTAEAVTALYQSADSLSALIKGSKDAYDLYVKAMDETQAYLDEHDDFTSTQRDSLETYLGEIVEPGDYPNGSYLYIMDALTLDNEQLAAEITYVQKLLNRAIANGISEGTDVTGLVANASLSLPGYNGWTVSKPVYGDFDSGMGEAAFPVAQAYNTAFDIHQDIQGVPQGLYRLDVNAFYSSPDKQPVTVAPTHIYMDDFETPIMDVYAGALPQDQAVDSVNCLITKAGTWPSDALFEDGYVPQSVNGASFAFMGGRYKQTVYGLVTGDGMRLGIKNLRTASIKDWSVFSNFKLTYMAKNADAVNDVLASLRERLDKYAEGDNYFNLEHYNTVSDLIDQCEQESEENAKYELLIQTNSAFNALTHSIDLYADLRKYLDAAYKVYWDLAQNAGADTPEYEAADKFDAEVYTPLMQQMIDGELSDEEAVRQIEIVRRDPMIDVVWVVGDVVGQTNWQENTGLYPLRRQEDGTYQGNVSLQTSVHAGAYGNRSVMFFEYMGNAIDIADWHPNWLAPARGDFKLRYLSGDQISVRSWGGEWKATVNIDSMTAHIEPVGEPVRAAAVYAIGNFVGNDWTMDRDHPLYHQGNGIYSGYVEMADGDHRMCIFQSVYSVINKKWQENRLGSCDGNYTVSPDQFGKPVQNIDPYYNDPAWVLEAGKFLVTFDSNNMSVTFTKVDKEEKHLTPYAFDLAAVSATESDATLSYTLTDDASEGSLNFRLSDGTLAHTRALAAEELTAGQHTVTVSNLPPTDLTWSVSVKGLPQAMAGNAGLTYVFDGPYGVAVDNDPQSKHFGTTYVVETLFTNAVKYQSGSTKGVGTGIYAFTPDFRNVPNAKGKTGFTGGLALNTTTPWGQGRHDPSKVALTEDGRLLVARGACNASPLYEADPDDLDAAWKPVFQGTIQADTIFTDTAKVVPDFLMYGAQGEYIVGGGVVALATEGQGDNLKVFTLSAGKAGLNDGGDFFANRYDLGKGTEWSTAPSATLDSISGRCTTEAHYTNLASDGRGGVWYVAQQSAASEERPSVKHVNAEGGVDFVNTSYYCAGGAVAVTNGGRTLAFCMTDDQIGIFDADYTTTPVTLTERARVGQGFGKTITGLDFDYAGNLVVASANGEKVGRFNVPSADAVETPAPLSQSLAMGGGDAIRGVDADTRVGAVYNVNGIRVQKTSRGIYVIDGKKVAVK